MLGVNIDSQTGSKGNIGEKYINAINSTVSIISERSLKPWYFPNKIFKLSKLHEKLQKYVNFMNNFVTGIIKEKKHVLYENNTQNDKEDSSFRKLFIDEVLRQLASTNHAWSDDDVRNEISTIIFGGSDTTGHTISKTDLNVDIEVQI